MNKIVVNLLAGAFGGRTTSSSGPSIPGPRRAQTPGLRGRDSSQQPRASRLLFVDVGPVSPRDNVFLPDADRLGLLVLRQ